LNEYEVEIEYVAKRPTEATFLFTEMKLNLEQSEEFSGIAVNKKSA
jgi:hypothetical protein